MKRLLLLACAMMMLPERRSVFSPGEGQEKLWDSNAFLLASI